MKKWLDELSDEDSNFLHRFVLASGSLKDLASFYGVSYPTIRLRLDRLIDKIKLAESESALSPFVRALRQQFLEGKVDSSTFKLLLDAHRKESEPANSAGEPE